MQGINAVPAPNGKLTFPPEWQAYVAALRAIVTSNSGSLPARPSYPAGT